MAAPIRSYKCTGGVNQKWEFAEDGTLGSNHLCLEGRSGAPDGGSNAGFRQYITNETKIHFAPDHGETLEVVKLASRGLQDAATLVTLIDVLGNPSPPESPPLTGRGPDVFTAGWFLNLMRGFPTEGEMMASSMGEENLERVLAAVSFYPDGNGVLPDRVAYAIRMDSLRVADPSRMKQNSVAKWGAGTYGQYLNNGFSMLQGMFDGAIIDFRAGRHIAAPVMYAQPFPTPAYVADAFTVAIGSALPLFMVLAWIYSM